MWVSSKRRITKRKAEPPITGVAAGSLGTAANLDDTQVIRTEDLHAAAAAPVAAPPESTSAASAPRASTPVSAAVASAPPGPRAAPRQRPRPRPRSQPQPQPRPLRQSTTRPRLALAGAGGFAALLLIAGAGFFSQLDLGIAAVPTIPGAAPTAAPAAGTPAPKPQAGKSHRGCHGHGHGNDCQGNED